MTSEILRRFHRSTRMQRDFVRTEFNIGKIRHRSKYQNIDNLNQNRCSAHGLFLYHQRNQETERHFERLVTETKGLVTWHRLFNSEGGGSPLTDLEYVSPALTMPFRYQDMMENGGVQGGFADVAIMPAVLASEAPFVWVMEYDVDFSGDWSSFFGCFSQNQSDFLTTMLRPYNQSLDWTHWPNAVCPQGVHRTMLFRSFNPIMRISKRFAMAYLEALRTQRWKGHYEFLLPSIAANGPFGMEELGGNGRLCPRDRKGKFYTASDRQDLTGPETFVWRPIRDGYYHETPDRFSEKNHLYHPCKSGVPDWRSPSQLERPSKLDSSQEKLSLSVVMATFNGEAYLPQQLESLMRQTRHPDELIIGDDASTDGTCEIIRDFANRAPFPVTLVERKERLGFAQNFIDLLKRSKQDLIFFCDQDDVWHDQKIDIVANAASVESALVFSHDLEIFNDHDSTETIRYRSYFDHLKRLGLNQEVCIKGCGMAVRRELLDLTGWAPDQHCSHDSWFGLIATALGKRATIEAPLVRHRIHDANTSGWLISEDEVRERVRPQSKSAFDQMLDLYLHTWPQERVDTLQRRLVPTGRGVSAEQTREAISGLAFWRYGTRLSEQQAEHMIGRLLIEDEFDAEFYQSQRFGLPDLEDPIGHYLETGWMQKLNPNQTFMTEFYLYSNPDVAEANINPFVHYLRYGEQEGRSAMPASEEQLNAFVRFRSYPVSGGGGGRGCGVVAMVKNEISIIETFIAHLMSLFDHIVVIDHGSTDGTLEYLNSVSQREAKLAVRHFGNSGYLQAEIMTYTIRTEPHLKSSKWLFFLDADEFLPFQGKRELIEALETHDCDPVIGMNWANLIPSVYRDGKFDPEISGPFYCPPHVSAARKVAIQPARINLEAVFVAQGNHDLCSWRGGPALRAITADFPLLHLPIRSREQIEMKAKQGSTALDLSNLEPELGNHWRIMNEYLQHNKASEEILNAMIYHYSFGDMGRTYSRKELLELGAQVIEFPSMSAISL
ncbi:glycosyltransferase [Martelella alba]|uniref:Glycosyltransferase n=1 Tax=Martelella alba TaxID=2590451 RepID=A0A506TX10_9HYPH|nr:glycosyltransferase [Martelella alba]TPW26572.1 glycosyltransferase [Martelella alba]